MQQPVTDEKTPKRRSKLAQGKHTDAASSSAACTHLQEKPSESLEKGIADVMMALPSFDLQKQFIDMLAKLLEVYLDQKTERTPQTMQQEEDADDRC